MQKAEPRSEVCRCVQFCRQKHPPRHIYYLPAIQTLLRHTHQPSTFRAQVRAKKMRARKIFAITRARRHGARTRGSMPSLRARARAHARAAAATHTPCRAFSSQPYAAAAYERSPSMSAGVYYYARFSLKIRYARYASAHTRQRP